MSPLVCLCSLNKSFYFVKNNYINYYLDSSALTVNNTNWIASVDRNNRSTVRYHDFN